MAKRNTYCEVNFLKKFSEKRPQTCPFDDWQLLQHDCWLGLYKYLRNTTILLIDDRALFNATSQEYQLCKEIKKRWANGSLKITEEKIDLDNLSEEYLCSSVFLCEDKPFIIQKAEKLGILLITPSTYEQFAYLYRNMGIAFHTNDSADWAILKQKGKHNFNTIVISDLYVLNDKRINLYAIFDALLPTSLDIAMHISIFTKDTPSFQKDWEEIKEKIHELRPRLNFNLSLHKGLATDFHDRVIVTNYMRMKCGAGFDLLKSKNGQQVARITTDVDIDYPYFFTESDVTEGSYENILKDARKMYINNICIGTKINRMLK